VVANALDSARSRAHTKAALAKQAKAAWHHETGEWLNVTPANIETAVEALKVAGYIIMPDKMGQGLRCERGVRNATPCVGGIIDGIGHQKKLVASTMMGQIVRPTAQAAESIPDMAHEIGRQMLEAFKAQTAVTIEHVTAALKQIESRQVVKLLLTPEQAEKVRKALEA